MYFNSSTHHVPLEPFCYACHTVIAPQEVFHAFPNNENSTAFDGWLGPLLFPPPGIQPPDRYMLCRKPRCSVCARSPEVFMFHNDCLRLFYQRCKANSLQWSQAAWSQAAWSLPWLRARAPHPTPTDQNLNIEGFLEAASKLGILHLHRLPPEILSIILSLCRKSLLWRFVSVNSAVDRISARQVAQQTVAKLAEIGHWEKGAPLQCSEWPKRSFIRLGMDAGGIKSINRFTTDDVLDIRGCQSYVVQKCEDLLHVSALVEHDSLRLVLPPKHPGFRVWDTPYPPSIESCEFFSLPSPSGRFRTVEVSKLTGITFFCWLGRVYGIHGHTKSLPSAREEHGRLHPKRRDQHVWIYLPLKGVQAIGLTGPSALIIKSNESVFQIGEAAVRGSVEVPCGLPSRVVLEEPYLGEAVPRIGLLVEGSRTLLRSTASHFNTNLYESSASLDDVQTVSLFHEPDGTFLRGMLFTYTHGGQRAVGECCLGVDQEEKIHRPRFLFYQSVNTGQKQRILARFATEMSQPSDWAGWICVKMVGKIELWHKDQSVVQLNHIR